jgi:hypothetical protein
MIAAIDSSAHIACHAIAIDASSIVIALQAISAALSVAIMTYFVCFSEKVEIGLLLAQ